LREMRERIVKDFMDIVVLAELRNGPMSGYDVIEFFHRKFNLLVSSGTVYTLLYSLERNGLIKGIWEKAGKKRVCTLTDKGEEKIKIIQDANEKIQRLVTDLLAHR